MRSLSTVMLKRLRVGTGQEREEKGPSGIRMEAYRSCQRGEAEATA